jgi:hypothetical protein
MIDDRYQVSVVAPLREALKLVDQLSNSYAIPRQILRALQRFSVSIPQFEVNELAHSGGIYCPKTYPEVMVLASDYYHPQLGYIREPRQSDFIMV